MKYELTVVMPGDTTSAKKKSFSSSLESILKVFKGKVVSEKDLGEIELAYSIAKNKTGYFVFYVLDLEKESVQEISEKIKLTEGVIRHLLVTPRKIEKESKEKKK